MEINDYLGEDHGALKAVDAALVDKEFMLDHVLFTHAVPKLLKIEALKVWACSHALIYNVDE